MKLKEHGYMKSKWEHMETSEEAGCNEKGRTTKAVSMLNYQAAY
jgi:hypothetical protein